MFWKRLFGLDAIYSRKTLAGLFLPVFYILPLSIFLLVRFAFVKFPAFNLSVIDSALPVIAAAVLMLAAGWFVRSAVKTAYVGRRLKRRRYVGRAGLHHSLKVSKAVINEELDKVDAVGLIEERKSWKIYDAGFDIVQGKGRGPHKNPPARSTVLEQAYYTVFEAELKRQVPHMLFDSKTAKKRQFGSIYSKSQRLSPGPAFETAFETYAPHHYQIDVLSLITPEVMEAMLAAKDYDIEMFDNCLFCYAPLLAADQLEGFRSECLNLRDHVNDNLRAYKDDSLRAGRRADVSAFGRELLRNHLRGLWPAIISGLILLFIAVVTVVYAKVDLLFLFHEITMVTALIFVVSIVDMVRLRLKNKKKEALFLSAQRQAAGWRRSGASRRQPTDSEGRA